MYIPFHSFSNALVTMSFLVISLTSTFNEKQTDIKYMGDHSSSLIKGYTFGLDLTKNHALHYRQ